MHAGVNHCDTPGLGNAALVIAERFAQHRKIGKGATKTTIFLWADNSIDAGIGQHLAGFERILASLVEDPIFFRRQNPFKDTKNTVPH